MKQSPDPAAPRPSSWHVRAVDAPAGVPPLGVGVALEGSGGFVRATLVVERPADPTVGTSARAALYDSLFPVGPEAHLRIEVTPPVPPATAPRVTLAVESAGVRSEAFVEPAVPFFEPGAAVTWQSALPVGQGLPDGAEVEIGRWTVAAGSATRVVVVRLLGSRRPIGPRLKGVSLPPR